MLINNPFARFKETIPRYTRALKELWENLKKLSARLTRAEVRREGGLGGGGGLI